MGDKFSPKNVGENSLRAKAKGLEARMKDLETGLSRLMIGIDRNMGQVGQMLGEVTEKLEAVIELVGTESVNQLVEAKRMDRAQEAADAEQKALEEAIADGYVTPTDVVAENSFIVAYETKADGKPLGTGRQSVAFKSLSKAAKETLLGKGVDFTMPTPSGGSFTVKEVYTLDEEKGRAILGEKARARAEAAQKAAAEAASQDEAASDDSAAADVGENE